MTRTVTDPRAPYGLRRYVLRLPLPNPVLSPNARPHWRDRARAVRGAKFAALAEANAIIIRVPGWQPIGRARIGWRFYFCSGQRRWDADNAVAACKAYQDGLVSAGLLAGDGAAQLAPGPSVVLHCTRGCLCGGRAYAEIEEMPG